MTDLKFNLLVEALSIVDNPYTEGLVLVARHASEAYDFLKRDVEAFEEYQRFQSKDFFRKCKYIIAFVGVPGKGSAATFAGIYRVISKCRRGEAGFREPEGDPQVVAACAGQSFYYGLSRDINFDYLQFDWEIIWNIPGPAKYQYMHQNLGLEIPRFSSATSMEEVKALMLRESLNFNSTDEVLAGSEGYSEGAQYYARHLHRERNAALVREAKRIAKASGSYRCFVCAADFQMLYGIDYIECHHTIPVSELSAGTVTKLEDVVLLCANCHRAVHRHVPWLQKAELHKLLRRPSVSRFLLQETLDSESVGSGS